MKGQITMNEDIIPVDSYDFEERVSSGIVLVYFYEYLNLQSRALETIIDEIAEQYCDSIKVLAADVEQSPDIAYHLGIESIPSVVIFNGGEPVEQIDGANPVSVYSDIIDDLL